MNESRSQKRINQIVRAATRFIADNGYSQLTMEGIAHYSGISRGGINHYFKTKQEILVAVLEALDKQLFAMVDSKVRKAKQIEDYMKLRISISLTAAKEDPVFIYLLVDFLALAMNNSVYGDRIRAFFKKYRGLTSLGLEPGIIDGRYGKVDRESIGTIVMAVIIGLGIQWKLDQGSFDYDKAAETAENMIMFYLKNKK